MMFRQLTEEEADLITQRIKQMVRKQEEQKQEGTHEYQHLVGLAERRWSGHTWKPLMDTLKDEKQENFNC